MAGSLITSTTPNLILPSSPFEDRTRPSTSQLSPLHLGHKPFLRGSACVSRFAFRPGLFPDSDASASLAKLQHLFERAESVLYTVADAAVSVSDTLQTTSKQNGDWLSGITNTMETVLKVLKDGLSAVHMPYAYGFAIILLTVLVKAATFPLTKKQVESAMAMRSLQPQIKAIQQRYAGNQEKIQLETARLYKLAGINPFAGCLPTLATIPVWIGLYRALSNVADEGLLTEGFFWIPSLAGPTTLADRQSGSGISWLFPFVDGHPPLGWSNTLAYLVLPVLLVISQYISVQVIQSSQSNDPNMKSSQAITKLLPLMIGYFALSVPSGLSLYWFTNNVLSTAQQVWLQKLGGAKNPMEQFSGDIFKEEKLKEKSASQLSSTKPKAVQEEELTSEGLRPGERFKQLKEQEARRRQQREEEKRKSQQIDINGSQIENGGLGEKEKLLEEGSGSAVAGADVVVEESVTTSDPLNEMSNTERTEVPSSGEVPSSDKKQSYVQRQQEAVEVNGSVTRADNMLSEEEKIHIKRE